ncbi:thioester reductase domain-containing protein, partial [Pelosinus propionicus]
VCFLSNADHQNKAAETIQALDPQTRILFISQQPDHTASSHTIYSISPKDPSSYEQAFQSIREEYGDVDGLLYLWPIEDTTCIEDYSVIVYLLQSMAAVKLKAGRVLLGGQFETGLERCYLDSWIGFERSLGLVLPNTQVAVMYQKGSSSEAKSTMEDWLIKLWSELQAEKLQSVFYQGGKRYVYQIQETFLEAGSSLLQAGGTYLITGGCGGLGFIFARHFAKTHGVNLILTGRSALDEEKQAKIQEIEALGSHALYLQADSCDVSSMKTALGEAKAKYGEIHGVIHAAGLAGSQSLFEKDLAGFRKIIEPKIKGTLVLDEVLQEEALHFMCYFSSSSAILGDFGSCDYAIGNRFQMAYAHYRQEKQLEGKAYGKSLVINWPLWKDGGMGVGEEENSKLYLKSSGQRFLEEEEGTVMFDCILSQSTIQQLVLVGQPSRIKRFLGLTQDDVSLSLVSLNSLSRGRRPEMKGLNLEQCIEWDLKEYISHLLKIPFNKLDKEDNLADFGFDSISLAQLATLLRSHYGIEVTATLFFGYSTIEKLIQYFVTNHHDSMHEFYKEEAIYQPMGQKGSIEKNIVGPKFQSTRFTRLRENTEDLNQKDSIAIVGMSGKFPMAEDVHELWKNIVEGRECIAEIPKERWDWQEFYGDSAKEVNKTKIKWGGFITGIGEFDSLFFKISPKEAESMDPKQRMLMTFVWRAMEDAGITPKEMSKKSTGVFIAACPSEYTDSVSMQNNSLALTATTSTVLPARISYALDLQGPSEYCDTACSSTLVALHRAVHAIQNGECEQAIVGTVNLLLSPLGFVGLDSLGYLSPEGKVRSFQANANGYARSEGVGALIIKPLQQAIQDKDQIFAVVKGTGVSHGGKGMSLTAPNANGMKAAMIQAYQAAKIDPRTVSYIEAHGIASLLGDGIEIDALKAGYQELVARQTSQTMKKQHVCHISSLKPCIGNAEVASGMAALIKVISAMRNKIIPGIAGFTTLSDQISLEGSPFQIAPGNCEWSSLKNIHGSSLPRRASINGYGFSGINAHVVLEEYIPTQERAILPEAISYIVPLSAKNRDRLDDYARNLLMFLKERDGAAADSVLHLADIAYTLQVGREAMESRISFIVKDIKEIMEKLDSFINGTGNTENCFIGDTKQGIDAQLFGTDDDFDELLQKWIAKGKVKKVAELWSRGSTIKWESMYQDWKPQRISLPTYPFAKECYKIFSQQEKKSSVISENAVIQPKNENLAQGNLKDNLGYITRLVRETLGLPANVVIDPQSQLREFGMDSISGIQILEKIRQELGVQLDGRRFFSEFTLQSIISQLESVSQQDKAFLSPWEMDKKLPMDIKVNVTETSFTHTTLPENVLLTGATGLLGAFLCNEILQQTSATVYCLVRAESDSLGLQRLQENLDKFSLWQSGYHSRIIPVLGDITMPQLGMEKMMYDKLSYSIDVIYHCAALPNHILNYYSLKSANVNGTLAIIEFAASGKIKPIHFTSTIAVCSQMDGDIILSAHQEETLLEQGKYLTSGYAQSKWVSEHHLMQAQARGIPVTIFRCGEITGSSQTGYGIAEDMVHNFLKIFIEVNVIPEWNEGVMDIVPIDYVSKVILTVSQEKDCYGKIYHLNHIQPFSVNDFFTYLERRNPLLTKSSFEDWADSCLRYISELTESPVKTIMLGFFTKLDSGPRIFEYYFTDLGLKNENLQKVLQKLSIHFPQMDDQWWEKCMKQIVLCGQKNTQPTERKKVSTSV